MADIRTFLCTWEQSWDIEVKIAVDFDILKTKRAAEINAFWVDADSRLASCDDEPISTVIRLAATAAIDLAISNSHASAAEIDRLFHDSEGWGDYDYNGIRITDVVGLPQVDFEQVTADEVDG
ncbi:DUF2528 family protein [Lysobacter brunescens]|uniref:DUF2528 family protein n=1 Tax=Lysobacter brunescens TaxID=262323 RepID=A0ABW2YEP2_9GAMM